MTAPNIEKLVSEIGQPPASMHNHNQTPTNALVTNKSLNYVYSTEFRKYQTRQTHRNLTLKSKRRSRAFKSNQPRLVSTNKRALASHVNDSDTPDLIKIINENQLKYDNKPDAPKKSLADHLRKKAIARFNQENKNVKTTKLKKQNETR